MATFTKSPEAIYFHIPKTAGSSISHWLEVNINGERIKDKHSNMSQHKHILSSEIFAFTCVRHPYDWVYSAYKWIRRTHFKCENLKLKDWIFCDNSEIHMLNNLCVKAQNEYLDMNRIDLIMKCENLSEDWKKIQEYFGNFNELEKRNAASSLISDDTGHNALTSEMKDVVYKQYKMDFELFNYQR